MFDPNRYVGSYQKNPENKTYNKKLAWTLKKINANKDKKEKRDYTRWKQRGSNTQILNWVLDAGRGIAMKDILKDYLWENILLLNFFSV